MGRPRRYATATERQAAYRARMKATTIWVDRAPFERIDRAITALQEELWRARIRGHPLAHELHGTQPVDTLEATVAWILQLIHQPQHTSDDHELSDMSQKEQTCETVSVC